MVFEERKGSEESLRLTDGMWLLCKITNHSNPFLGALFVFFYCLRNSDGKYVRAQSIYDKIT